MSGALTPGARTDGAVTPGAGTPRARTDGARRSRLRRTGTLAASASRGPRGRGRRRPLLFATAAALACLLAPAAAAAEEPAITAQARMANAEFLAYAPPPEGGAVAVCLVDTGLDLNPDTAPNLVERLALDGGDPGDVYPSRHGTRMAMLMGGQRNGWGSVGVWPYARVVSVRAMPPGESTFPFTYYKRAVVECRRRAAAQRIYVANLSLGGSGATDEEIERLRNAFAAVQADGINVVAAAGNGGAAVEYPAAVPEAFAVGAADAAGALCSFSGRGPELDVVAPACEMDIALADGTPAYSGGTSDSSAFTAAVIAALRSYRPDLGPLAAEELLRSTAREVPAGRFLDVEAAFRVAGLGDVVEAGNAAAPPPSPPPGSPAGDPERPARPSVGPLSERLPRPRLRAVSYRRGLLSLRLANRRRGTLVAARVVYSAGRGEFRRRERALQRFSSSLRVRPPVSWSRVFVQYRSFDLESSRQLVVTRRSLVARSDKRRGT